MNHVQQGELGTCDLCECSPGYMTKECPGTPLDPYQKERVGKGRLDFYNGQWFNTIKKPRCVGTMEQVIAFLQSELVSQ